MRAKRLDQLDAGLLTVIGKAPVLRADGAIQR